MTGKENTLIIATNLPKGKHSVLICKATEAAIGYIEFVGIKANNLLAPDPLPTRKIEFIGNSITCGMGADLTIPCGTKDWFDQHNAYKAYGPTTARNLNAQWHLSSVSGIGLMQSCCGHKFVLPDVFDKVNLTTDGPNYDFSLYQPDVVTVCLEQNDGIRDSIAFTGAYLKFLDRLKTIYPKASLVCLNSPMADEQLNTCFTEIH